MNIVIIGAGNVATVLAKCLVAKQYNILQIINRDVERGKMLAHKVKATHFNTSLSAINQEADFYIIAVNDNAIAEIVKSIHIKNGILLHTAGSININVLQPGAEKYGVLYPLQSLRSTMNYMPDIPFLVEGNDHKTEQTIYKWATQFSKTVKIADSTYRAQAHLAAVIASNFTNYLYILAEQYCAAHNIDFDLLLPLIQETANRLKDTSPINLQTGPAVRNDKTTMQKHEQLLQKHPQLLHMYTFMSQSIQKMYQK